VRTVLKKEITKLDKKTCHLSMKNWKQILIDVYTPEVGSILAAPNRIWTNSFAANKPKKDYHPALLGKISNCRTSCNIVPGTSKEYKKGSCVYKVKLNTTDSNWPLSHFLIEYWMTINLDDLLNLKSGWNGIKRLNESQLKDLRQQIKFCRGIDV
jgi:hypothetical protein